MQSFAKQENAACRDKSTLLGDYIYMLPGLLNRFGLRAYGQRGRTIITIDLFVGIMYFARRLNQALNIIDRLICGQETTS
jgi:hypothetical protein